MNNFQKHLIRSDSLIEQALLQLDKLAKDAILFVVDDTNTLLGSLTDGDVRRGLIRGAQIGQPVTDIIQSHPRFIRKGDNDIQKLIDFREGSFRIIPVINQSNQIVKIINFRETYSYLPIDAVIMAGGRGQRLMPFTQSTPKPLLKVGDKPIIEHNINRLSLYGICDFWISINYLGDQIKEYFGDGSSKNIKVSYVSEDQPLGTIGAVAKIDTFQHEYVLITNSDILTNLNYEDFFVDFLKSEADFAVVTIPYQVTIPYAVLETNSGCVSNFIEKPTYTYYSNGGIYLAKRSVLRLLPRDTYFNATDLMEILIEKGMRIFSYPLIGYWKDIGSPEDFQKAQVDIKHVKF